MSDKPHDKLWEADRLLRQAWPAGMNDGVHVTIKLISGFELFNTRPYHNYETWSNGWVVEDENGVKAQREDLDDAVNAYLTLLVKYRTGSG